MRALVLLGCLALGCGPVEAEPAAQGSASATVSASAPAPSASGPSAAETEAWARCAKEREEALAAEPFAGIEAIERDRLLAARVRGRALWWRRAPARAAALDRRIVEKKQKPLAAVRGLLRDEKSAERRRSSILREGYLFEEDGDVALALVETVGLTQLFDEPKIYLQRGVELSVLERKPRDKLNEERYVHTSGVDAGRAAEILLGDRVAAKPEELSESEPLVIDLRDAIDRGSFDRLVPERFTRRDQGQKPIDKLVAKLRYGPGVWVPALFDADGAKLELRCEALTPELAAQKQRYLETTALWRKAFGRMREVVHQQVIEGLPFDSAPEQENGFARKAWERAYFKGWRRTHVREEELDVYGAAGQPLPPQVCIDFLTDTLERAAGSWYAPNTGPEPKPSRPEGPIDFDKVDLKNRRSVASFVGYVKRHPELFDVWSPTREERVPFRDRARFFQWLEKEADRIRLGDMLILYGHKDGGRPHYHTLVVLETDPVSGVPTLIAGNAVLPREQTLEGIMQISPQRTIRHRIRVLEPWLGHIAAQVK